MILMYESPTHQRLRMARTALAAATGRSRRPLCAPGIVTTGQPSNSAAARAPAARDVSAESSPKQTAATVFDARTRSQSGPYVMTSPYSFAIKPRPLRIAYLASALVIPGASGSGSPIAPKKTLSALETFPAATISSKTGAAPKPTPSPVTAGSCKIADDTAAASA